MLSREKVRPERVRISRNNTLPLTNDTRNSSTKLILVNLSKKDDNLIRGSETSRHSSVLPRVTRCTHHLTRSARTCDCQNLDKASPQAKKGQKEGPEESSRQSKITFQPQQPTKNKNTSQSGKLPPCPAENNGPVNTNRKINHSSSTPPRAYQRHSKRDLDIFCSMPSLCHPDFTAGQQRALLALARIYTNIKPNSRSNTNLRSRESTFHNRPITFKEKNERRPKVKDSIEKKEEPHRSQSLQTAVSAFSPFENNVCVTEYEQRLFEEKLSSDNKQSGVDDPELDELLEEYIMTIIQDQADFLTHKTNCRNEIVKENDIVNTEGEELVECDIEEPMNTGADENGYDDKEDKQPTEVTRTESTVCLATNAAYQESSDAIIFLNEDADGHVVGDGESQETGGDHPDPKSEDIHCDVNILRHISDELRQSMTKQ